MSTSKNKEYSEKYCLILTDFLSRKDKHSPAMKGIIRYVIRAAVNTAKELPGYDNKLGAEIISKKALLQIKTGNLSGLIGEHAVPISIVNNMLLNMESPEKCIIEKTIQKFSLRAVITADEDIKLKNANLTKRMPPNWDGESVMTRYDFCEIPFVKIAYKAIKNGYLNGEPLTWCAYAPVGANERYHCEFCAKNFMLDGDRNAFAEGYKTQNGYRWICKTCFDDFVNLFGWQVV
jgi:hypothetical protein